MTQLTDRIGRRIKLRDLRVVLAVAHSGSLSKAAESLAVSFPVVSRTVSTLEHALGVRLFDRTAVGVEPTMYGRALIKSSTAVIDELRRGVEQIEFLSDPSLGELRIGTTQPMMAGLLSIAIDQLISRYPKMAIQATTEAGGTMRNALRERTIDVLVLPSISAASDDDLVSEFLFNEKLFVVAGLQSRWARRRRVELDELMDELWALPLSTPFLGALITKGFRSRGLDLPKRKVDSDSVHLRNSLLATGRYLSVLPESMLRFGPRPLTVKRLPLAPLGEPLPYKILTLKNRTISPVTQLFIDCIRELVKPLVKEPKLS